MKNLLFLVLTLLLFHACESDIQESENLESPSNWITGPMDANSTGRAGAPSPETWDDRTDLMQGEPIDPSILQASFERAQVQEGQVLRDNIDLSQGTINYFTVNAQEEPAQGEYPREAEALEILDFGPVGELPIEMSKPTIFVMFNHAMVPIAKLGEPITNADFFNIEPPVTGTYRWYGSRALSFEPDTSLLDHPYYQVTLGNGISSLGGRSLEEDFQFTFHTEPIEIVNYYAGNDPESFFGTWNVPLEAAKNIVLEFNQEVDPNHLQGQIIVNVGSTPVSYTVARPNFSAFLESRIPRSILLQLDGTPPEETYIRVILPPGTSPKPGYPERVEEQQKSLRTLNQFKAISLDTYSYDFSGSNMPSTYPLYLNFSHPINESTIPETFRIWKNGTAVESVGIESSFQTIRINLDNVSAGDQIRVSVPSGIRDFYGRDLRNPGNFTTDIPEPWPFVNFPAYGFRTLEASFDPGFVWESRNIVQAEIGLEGRPNYLDNQSSDISTNPLDISSFRPNRVNYSFQDLKPFLGSEGYGTVFTRYSVQQDPSRFSREEYSWYNGNFTIQVTNMGITARLGFNKLLVWVNTLNNGAPISSATVQAFSHEGQNYTQITDTEGLAVFEFEPQEFVNAFGSDYENQLLLRVSNGQDVAELPFANYHNTWAFDVKGRTSVFNAEEIKDRFFLFSDRGLYKSGEELAFRGIFWKQNYQGFRPASGSYLVSIRDPSNDRYLWSESGQLSFSGGFAHRLTLPEDLEPGNYNIVYVGQGKEYRQSFQIAQFRRLSFQVNTSFPSRIYTQGESLGAQVQASYLAGGALPGANYTYYWTRRPTDFVPPGNEWKGMSFGPGTWEGEMTLSDGGGNLTGSGSANINVSTADQSSEGRSYTYTLETTVEDVDRQVIASRGSAIVHPADFYIGARFASNSADGWWSRFVSTGQNVSLEAFLVDPMGNSVSLDALATIKIIQGQWKTVQQQGVYGRINTRWEYVEETVEETVQSFSNGVLNYSFNLEDSGSYRIVVSAQDSSNRTSLSAIRFYASGSGWVRQATQTAESINMVVDKDEYLPGETARILVQSPVPQGRYLLTIEREGIFEESVIELEGSQELIEVPVKSEYLPIFYVALSSFTPRTEIEEDYFQPDLGKPRKLFGVTSVNVSTRPVELDVEVLPLAGSYQPGDTAEIAVRVTQNGTPVQNAELTLLAVDRGVLDLIDYRVPNPLDFFYDPYNFPLGVEGDDSRRLLMRPVTYDVNSLQGGDGGKSEERIDFNPLALFEPFVATDENGLAKVSFTLPDNLTTYRITALALRESRLGITEGELLVQNPINIRTALPRRLRNRDTAAAGLVLTNLTSESQEIRVTATSDILNIAGQSTKTIMVPPAGVYELPFILEASTPGEGLITFEIESAVLNERLTKVIEVERPLIPEAFTTIGVVSGTESQAISTEGLVIPSQRGPDFGGLTFIAGNRLKPYISQSLYNLSQFSSYGLVASQLYSIIGEYLQTGTIADYKMEKLEEFAQIQDPDGYIYRSYNGRRYEQFFLSVLVAQTLKVIEDFPMESWRIPDFESLLDYLETKVQDPGDFADFYELWALNLVTEEKNLPMSVLNSYRRFEDALGLAGYNLLAQSYLNVGNTQIAQEIYQRSKNFVLLGTQSLDIKDTYEASGYFQTKEIELALMLKTGYLLQENQGYLQRLTRSLDQGRLQRRFHSKFDDFWIAMGFLPLIEAEDLLNGETDFTIDLQGQSILSTAFNDQSTEFSQTFSFDELSSFPEDTNLPMVLSRSGEFPIYYTSILEYGLPGETALARDEGIEVFSQIESLDGELFAENELPLGETFRMRVFLSTTKRRNHLSLLVPIPSGSEVLDPGFTTTGSFDNQGGISGEEWTRETIYGDEVTASLDGVGYYDDSYWFWQFYGPERKIYDNGMYFSWADFYPGQREVSFLIRTTTPGVYPTPGAMASLEFEPEVFGRSDGRLLLIR